MKYSLLKIALICLPWIVTAQGISFFEGNWKDALEVAKKQNKLVFVDAYAEWCGPCKMMARNVFPQPAVGEYFNKHFVSMKIDMEKGQGLEFRQKYPVSAFPTFFFLDPGGIVVLNTKGARDQNAFIQLAQSAVSKYNPDAQFVKLYESGNREYETIVGYVRSLNRQGKSSLAVSNAYLNTQKNLSTPENLKFILEATTEADSRIFDLCLKYRQEIGALTSAEEVNNKLQTAADKTMNKAIEYKSAELLAEVQNKMSQAFPLQADEFKQKSNLTFSLNTRNVKAFIDAANNHLKGENKKDAFKHHLIAQNVLDYFKDDQEALDYGAKVAEKACNFGGQSTYYYTYARILYQQNKKSEASLILNKAIALAKERQESTVDMEKLRKALITQP